MKYLLFLFSFLLTTLIYCQGDLRIAELNRGIETETSIAKILKVNDEFLLNEDYYNSLISGKRLVELDSGNANFNYRYGLALFKILDDLSAPLLYLKRSVINVSQKADIFKAKEKRAPLLALFFYGIALHRIGEVDEALFYYHKYLSEIKQSDPNHNEVLLKIKQANNAKALFTDINVKHLDLLSDSINSANSDYSPMVSFDGSRLYFTSRRPWEKKGKENQLDKNSGTYTEDVYMSDFKEDRWSKPVLMDFNTVDKNEASISMTLDERRVFLYNSINNGDIYYTYYNEGKFKDIKALPIKGVNNKDWQSHFQLTNDGKIAVFSSNVAGGYGGLDLYMMKKDVNGNWGKPINMGPEINSKYNEDAPYISFDGQYLYFSSDNENSIGGYDLFRATYKDGKFVEPKNMGYPINSTYDDLYYTVTFDGMTAFISSFRKGGYGGLDLYKIVYSERTTNGSVLMGRIFMADDSDQIPENIEMQLKCLNCTDTAISVILPRIRDGKFMANLEKCKDYTLKYYNSKTKAVIATQTLKTNCDQKYEEIYRELGIEVNGNQIIPTVSYALKGSVYDKETGEKIRNASVEIQNEKGVTLQVLTTDEEGMFKTSRFKHIIPNQPTHFAIIVKRSGYVSANYKASILADSSNSIINIGGFGLEKATVGKNLGDILALNPIYYDLNSSYLRKDAKVELDKIVKAMNENPHMVIDLKAHTDCRESIRYNIWLSDRRAKRAADYIKERISNGATRISGRGYGESQLVNECACDIVDDSGCSEAQHQANRRTEFIIIKE